MPVEKFRSKEAYLRNLSYRHMHGIPMTASKVCIKGSCHEVKHSKNPEREKIDSAQKRKVARRKTSMKGRKISRKVKGKKGMGPASFRNTESKVMLKKAPRKRG